METNESVHHAGTLPAHDIPYPSLQEALPVEEPEITPVIDILIFPSEPSQNEPQKVRRTPNLQNARVRIETENNGAPFHQIFDALHYEEQLTIDQVSKRLNYSQTTIRRLAKSEGMPVAIQYRDLPRQQKLELAAEAQGMDIETMLQNARNTARNKTEAAALLGISVNALDYGLRQFGIPPFTRSESLKRFHSDEARSQEYLARVHTTAANEKKSKGVAKAHQEGKIKISQEKREARQQQLLTTITETLGEDPQTVLQQLLDSGESYSNIGKRYNISSSRVKSWCVLLDVKRSPGIRIYKEKAAVRIVPHRADIFYAIQQSPLFASLKADEQAFILRRAPIAGKGLSLTDIGPTRQAAHAREKRLAERVQKLLAQAD